MGNHFDIYQLNAQSADKLDERRDATTRAHGGLCVVVATAAVGTLQHYPTISAVLWAFLAIVALGWLATLKSLTTKSPPNASFFSTWKKTDSSQSRS